MYSRTLLNIIEERFPRQMFLLYMWCMEAFVYKYILNYLLTNIEDDMEVVTKPTRYQGILFTRYQGVLFVVYFLIQLVFFCRSYFVSSCTASVQLVASQQLCRIKALLAGVVQLLDRTRSVTVFTTSAHRTEKRLQDNPPILNKLTV